FLAARRIDDALAETFGDRRLEDLWTTCFVVSCNLSRAGLVVHRRGPVRRYVRASVAVPGILPPLCEDGELLVDGSVVNSVPADIYVVPPLGSMRIFETGRFEETVELGYRAGLEAIADWRARGGAVVGG